ncbi:hypothetical protein EBR66_06410 [bacterium]|nr:hypothetical protein [bacterium]
MNTLGEWYNPFTWFDDSTPEISTGGSVPPAISDDPFGWNNLFGGGGSATDIFAGVSDSQLNDWNTYWSSGGVMGADLSNQPSTNLGTNGSDFLSGINDFLKGITGVAQTGLGIWQGVQTIINQQNPADELVRIPGSSTPLIKRTVDGKIQYYPITQLYPSLAPQVQQAQQNSWIGPALIVGVVGLGLILILKKD